MPNVNRFIEAQDNKENGKTIYTTAFGELDAGQKRTHWIWYIFPQIDGIVKNPSSNTKFYAIADLSEACEYLQNSTLFFRYYEIAHLVSKKLDKIHVNILMGGNAPTDSVIDTQKLISSLTLYQKAASVLEATGDTLQNYTGLKECCDQILVKLKNQNPALEIPCPLTVNCINNTQSFLSPSNDELSGPIHRPHFSIGRSNNSPPPFVPPGKIKLDALFKDLEEYINKRVNEWIFHYNFFAIMTLIYWISDKLCGTDYLNTKSRETKLAAASVLQRMIDVSVKIELEDAQKIALANGRLGELINRYGGLDRIINAIKKTKENEDKKIVSVGL